MCVSVDSPYNVLLRGQRFPTVYVPKIAKTTCSRVVHVFFISLITRDRLDIEWLVQQTFFVGNNFPHLDLEFRDGNLITLIT